LDAKLIGFVGFPFDERHASGRMLDGMFGNAVVAFLVAVEMTCVAILALLLP